MVAANMLRDELLSVPGVESAVVEGDALTPQGVRVRLSAGVDATVVGEEVQRVLAAHGLRSEMAPPQPPSTEPVSAASTSSPASGLLTATRRPRVGETLAKVSVVEGRDGIIVRAETSRGRSADRAALASGDRLDDAVVAAVADLAGVLPMPVILSIDERDVEDTPVVTIVLEAGRDRYAGCSVIQGGRPFALGLATWMALELG
jgi:hypothetical protein